MKTFSVSVLLVLSVSLLSGCINTARIKETHMTKGNGDALVMSSPLKVEGIPFKTKKAVYNQSTQYAQTWLKVSLIIQEAPSSPTQKPTQYPSFQKMIAKSQLPQLDAIKKKIFASNKKAQDVDSIIDDFQSIQAVPDLSKIEKELIANTVKPEWVVDDTTTYYLNSPLPWFGTNNITQKLNADMTLSEVSLNPDTKLADGLSSLVPLKEYLTGRFIKSNPTASPDAAANTASSGLQLNALSAMKTIKTGDKSSKKTTVINYNVSLDVTETGYIYTFTKQLKDRTAMPPIPFDTGSHLFTRQPLSAAASDKEEKEDDSQSIAIKGLITLPKAEAASK